MIFISKNLMNNFFLIHGRMSTQMLLRAQLLQTEHQTSKNLQKQAHLKIYAVCGSYKNKLHRFFENN